MLVQRSTSSVQIPVRVRPEACGDEVVGWTNGTLRIHVMAASDRGQANCAVETLLAEVLGVPRQRVNVVLGHATARKVVKIVGLDEADIDRDLPGRFAADPAAGERTDPAPIYKV